MVKCTAVTAGGRPCQASAGPDGKCFWHSDKWRAQRTTAQQKGGLHRRRAGAAVTVELKTAADVLALVAGEIGAVLGTLEPGAERARAVGSLCAIALRAVEQSEIEERLSRIEATLAAQGGAE